MKRAVISVALVSFLALQFSCGTEGQKPRMNTFKEKYSYMIGLDVGNEFKRMQADMDYNAFLWGVKDMSQGRSLLLTPETLDSVKMEFSTMMQQSPQGQAMQKEMQEVGGKNLKAAEEFLAANKKKPGVATTASGLQYLVLKKGSGPKPAATDKVKVHYVGTLLDGKEFDSSIGRGEPAVFQLSGIIPGWIEALQLMNTGSKYKLFIPPSLGYGANPNGPGGPNSLLIFEVELLGIEK
ncbi:MAG: FKBP-type peptidyl-prolyl cis-trans isomerase [Chitinispirillaceae bacterium]|nr:FKBP-type peptidyl-prolyl cis-trans isomerase [Chitinispirillaceae bacterium]